MGTVFVALLSQEYLDATAEGQREKEREREREAYSPFPAWYPLLLARVFSPPRGPPKLAAGGAAKAALATPEAARNGSPPNKRLDRRPTFEAKRWVKL